MTSPARFLANLLNSSGLVPLPTKVAGVLPDANAPSGSVINTWLARSESTSAFSTSSTSLQNVTALDVTLTPQSASSKFLITCYLAVGKYGWQQGCAGFGLARNSTTVYGEFFSLEHYGADDSNSTGDGMVGIDFAYIDSPNTTSPITYRPQLRAVNSSYSIHLNRMWGNSSALRGVSYLMIQEIAP